MPVTLLLWCLTGCGLSIPKSAHAVIVTNVTTDVVIFNSSGFEHDVAGHEPFAALQKSASPKPWKSAVAPLDEVILRTDRTIHAKPPIGGEGLRYLRTTRNATGEGHPVALLSSLQSRAGDLIRMEFSLQLPPDVDATITLGHEGKGAIRGLLRLHAKAVQFHDGSQWQALSPKVTFVPGKWQDWTLEYTVGGTNFSARVEDGPAGVASTLESMTTKGGGSLSQLGFAHLREQSYAIDSSAAARNAASSRRTEVQASQDLPQMLQINWRTGPDLPQGVQTVGAGVVHDTLVWVGGFCSGGTLYPGNEVPGKKDRYPRGFVDKAWGLNLTDSAARWQSMPALPGAARQAWTSAVVDDVLHVWGGFSYNDELTYRDGYRLSRSAGAWQWERLPDLPWKFCFAGAAAADDWIYTLGGADVSRNPGGTYHTEADRAGNTPRLGARLLALNTKEPKEGWRELPPCPGTPRFMPGTAIVGEHLYVFGGISGHDNPRKQVHVVVDNWRYHLASRAWERLDDLPVASSRHPNNYIVFKNRYILLIGGAPARFVLQPDGGHRLAYGRPHRTLWGRTMFSDVTVYDTLLKRFGRANPMPLCNNMPTAVLHEDNLYLIGGEPEGVEFNGVHYGHHPDLLLIGNISPVNP